MSWSLAFADVARQALGVHAVSNTSVLVAGGGGSIAQGPAVFASEDAGATWAAAPGIKLSMVNAIGASPHGRVAFGVSLYGQSLAFHAEGDLTAAFKGSSDHSPSATSGQDVEWLGDSTFAAIGQFNSWHNKSACTVPASPQCSGVLLTRDGGYTYEHVDWMGTDGPGTDASGGAFPSANVWYVAGGFVQDCSGGPLCYKAYVTKTTDGGKTFKTVHNVTATADDPGAGVGRMDDIDCIDETTCFAVSSCDMDQCANGIYDKNKTHGYGGYIHRTTDGGATWEIVDFAYEMSRAHVQMLSKDEVWACGGSVGLVGHASCWHTTDGGDSWAEVPFKPSLGSAMMGLSMLADGSGGFATVCNMLTHFCGAYKYVPA